MDVEKGQLENELATKIDHLEAMKAKHREEETMLENHISKLSEKLDNLISSIPAIAASVLSQRYKY